MQNTLDTAHWWRILQPVMTAKTLTLRLPTELHRKAAALAARRAVSLNRLVQEGLELLQHADEQDRLYEEFGLIGGEEADISFARAAQAEVVLGHEHDVKRTPVKALAMPPKPK
jgi:hypothetical protein